MNLEGLFSYFHNFLGEHGVFYEHRIQLDITFSNLHLATVGICIIINNILLFFSTEIKNHFKKKVIPYMATRIGFVKTELTKKISLIDGIKFILKGFKDGFNKARKK